MDVFIDALIYQNQRRGGISRIYNEILPQICEMDSSLKFHLMTSGRLKQPLPTHANIQHLRLMPVNDFLRPYRFWWPFLSSVRSFVQKSALKDSRDKVWHSTYYSQIEEWQGPVVVTVADMIHEHFAHLFKRERDRYFRDQKRKCIVNADAVICISETTAIDLRQMFNVEADRIQVIPLAYSSMFRPLQAETTSRFASWPPFFLYVGDHLTHYKNFKFLLQAYANWKHRNEVDLVVVGSGWAKDELSYIRELGVENQIRLLSNIDDETLCNLYNLAVAFIYPSLYEGFGIPLLEAMACGCPVIASNIPSSQEVAGDCPIYFDPTKVHSLIAALDASYSEGRLSKRIEAGISRAKCFSWEKTAKKTLSVYRSLQ